MQHIRFLGFYVEQCFLIFLYCKPGAQFTHNWLRCLILKRQYQSMDDRSNSCTNRSCFRGISLPIWCCEFHKPSQITFIKFKERKKDFIQADKRFEKESGQNTANLEGGYLV